MKQVKIKDTKSILQYNTKYNEVVLKILSSRKMKKANKSSQKRNEI